MKPRIEEGVEQSPHIRRRAESDASPPKDDAFSPQQRYALDLQRQILEQNTRRDRERRAVREEKWQERPDDRQERPDDRIRRQRQQQAELLNAQVEENKRRRDEAAKKQAEQERREDERVQREQQQMRDRYLSEKGLRRDDAETLQRDSAPEPQTIRRSDARRKASEERRKAERDDSLRASWEPTTPLDRGSMEQTTPLDSKLLLHLAAQVDRLVQDSQHLQEQLAIVQRQTNPSDTVRSAGLQTIAPGLQTIAQRTATTASTQTTAESWAKSSATKHADSVDLLAGAQWAPQPLPSHPVAAQRRGIAKPRRGRSAMLDELEQRSHDASYAVF